MGALARVARGLAATAALVLALGAARGGEGVIPGAPAGQVETGAPAFIVLAPETMGLSAAPSDLHILPDGRVLVVARHELAFSDGTRWETVRAADGQPPVYTRTAVDDDGTIYCGADGGIARIEFNADGRWRSTRLLEITRGRPLQSSSAVAVSLVGRDWYWYSGGGSTVVWRPGMTAQWRESIASIEHIFELNGEVFTSDQASGGLYRMSPTSKAPERLTGLAHSPAQTVTAAVPFGPGEALVGTSFSGVRRFDGQTMHRFVTQGPLAGENRINDVCVTEEGLFAAAVDNVGIVFFDREGRIVQSLDRSLDHRLARVQRIRYGRDGILWCLLNEGIARIEFPSPVSRFEPLIPKGLAYAQPVRHEGLLWVLADGHAMRGVYDASNRLQRFEEDNPPGLYVFTLDALGGKLFAGTDQGLFCRTGAGWDSVVEGVVNPRIAGQMENEAFVYAARGELGLARPNEAGFDVRRIPVSDLTDNYASLEEKRGLFWLELGAGRVARLDLRHAEPSVRFLGVADGLRDGWVEIFMLEGAPRFHMGIELRRYDEVSGQFYDDTELLSRFHTLAQAFGRPTPDPAGRLWFTSATAPTVLDVKDPAHRVTHPVPVSLSPTSYTVERSGVVWMFSSGRLVRYDPNVRVSQAPRLRALITSVLVPGAQRHAFAPRGSIPPVAYRDNSVIFRFAAPASRTGSTIEFETLLDGGGGRWVRAGANGVAEYSRLKEGHYTFRVRPVTNNGVIGDEAQLAFTVLPPWYRTLAAWTAYVLFGLGTIAAAIWVPAYVQRREKARLGLLVAQRTEQLNATNRQLERQVEETLEKSQALAASQERYRALNEDLENRVRERTAELSNSNLELFRRETLFRLMFEHAPVGVAWRRADLDGVYHFNPTYRRILELPNAEEPDGGFTISVVHPDDRARKLHVSQQITSGQIDRYSIEERYVLGKDRIIWGSLSVAVIRDQAGAIVQEIRILEDITARKRAEAELAATYKNLVDASRMAGMAEVATGVLHNVGNVLNSLNVSSNLITNAVRQSKAESLGKLSSLVHEHLHELPAFLSDDPKGRLVPKMLAKLAEASVTERDWLLNELTSMQTNIDHIKEIVAMQQSYATVIGVVETLDPATLFEDALNMNRAALQRHDVRVVRQFDSVPLVSVEKGKVLQILVNVIRNAKYACDDGQAQFGITDKVITLGLQTTANGNVRLTVRDNGIGIPPENLTRIFAHGFTTRAYGHGFGLHSSAIAAREMKGSLVAESEGLGKGATFILELPASAGETAEATAGVQSTTSQPPFSPS